MAFINIKDLTQSDELDREAMRSIVGGARSGERPIHGDPTLNASSRIVDYPPGFRQPRSESGKL